MIYGDVALDTIVLDSEGYVDTEAFSLAQDVYIDTCLEGKLLYQSPECVRDKPFGVEADSWALGCLTYELLVGSPPFFNLARDQESIRKAIELLSVSFPDSSIHDIKISNECKDFISRLLAKNLEDR